VAKKISKILARDCLKNLLVFFFNWCTESPSKLISFILEYFSELTYFKSEIVQVLSEKTAFKVDAAFLVLAFYTDN
jgi:hypothetical protein